MKKFLSLLLITVLALTTILTGCNIAANNTQPTEATEEETKIPKNSTKMLNEYFASFVEGDNPIYGTWELKGFEYVSFIFRNDNLAEMVMGTEGNFASLALDEEKKTLGVSFIIGLNGVYDYKLSDDNNTLTLTLGDSKTTLKRKDAYDFVPDAPKKPVIDEDILGWWKGENEIVYYFGKDGIMYSNTISMETCYTYEAADGVINAVYDLGGEVTDEIDYKVTKKGLLKIKGDKYSPYDPFAD